MSKLVLIDCHSILFRAFYGTPPLTKSSDGKTLTWPDSFSYESEGDLYFSVPVPHALGDYVIVEYDVTTK